MKIVQQSSSDERQIRNNRSRERKIDNDLAVTFLKAAGHPGRLAILNYLSTGEKSVGMLETLLDTRQAAVSQLLARLRQEGLVQCRREGKTIFYRLADARVERFVGALQDVFRP
jgi:ArsR family transcriptional regulator